MSEKWNASLVEEQGEDDEDDEKSTEKGDNDDEASACLTCSSQLLDDDIIDISGLDMDNEETWLFQANPSELSFDLRTWLTKDFDNGRIQSTNIITNYDNNDIEVGSTIDTRTFTRCKRKMAKLNTDSMRDRTLPGVVYNDNGDSPSPSSSWRSKMKINWKEEETRNEDCIPAMLRQSLQSGMIPPGASPQESLEAFLNMSQSKGIDSFINLAEPEFNESLMNISRPSLLHTTVNSTVAINNPAMADSQILTESMMQTSMFNDVDDIVNDNFTDNLFGNNTLVNAYNFHCETVDKNWLDSSSVTSKSNETFTARQSQQESSFIVNRTFDRQLPTDNTNFRDTTITLVEDSNTKAVNNSNETFVSNALFSKKNSLNATFQAHEIDECDEMMKNDIILEENYEIVSSNSTYVANDELNLTEEKPNNELEEILNNEPSKSLDMTYSKSDCSMLKETVDFVKLPSSSTATTATTTETDNNDMLVGTNLSTDNLPANRYQTYRKTATVNNTNFANKLSNPMGKMPLVKSMESLSKISFNSRPVSQEINAKFNGPSNGACLSSRLPQTLQKSNPNLVSHRPTVARGKTKKVIQQSKFGFQCPQRAGALVKNSQPPTLTNRLTNLAKGYKLETRNSNESIESTVSTCSGPDFDDGLSTCSDGGRHMNYQQATINPDQFPKIPPLPGNKSNQESTPKSVRKILDDTWITSEKDLPSPILKSNESLIGTQVHCSNNAESEIQTSSPLLSPAASLQSLAPNFENHHTTDQVIKIARQQESLPLNKLTSVMKPAQNLESKTDGVRVPISRSSNIPPSGIPRPASRIPAPRFTRTNAQVKSQSSLKKSLF